MATDIDFKLKKSFSKTDINFLKDEECLKTSMRNILLTSFGERPFQPDISSIVPDLLFEKGEPSILISIRESVEQSLLKYEKRIDLLDVEVTFLPNYYSFNINIYFSMKTSNEVQNINIPLKRIK